MCKSGIVGSTIQVGHYFINHCIWHNLSYQKYSAQRGTRTHDPQMPEYLSNIKVWCSTDWASRAHVLCYVTHISIVTCVSFCLCIICITLCLWQTQLMNQGLDLLKKIFVYILVLNELTFNTHMLFKCCLTSLIWWCVVICMWLETLCSLTG